MAFERNDIVNKTRLMGELGEELMGFEHNDIVTVDVMNEAIAEGGGGGGGDYKTLTMTISADDGSFIVYVGEDNSKYQCILCDEDGTFANYVEIAQGAESTYTVLYNGDSTVLSPYNVVHSVTGDATYDSDTGFITATGDFTVVGYMND